VSEGENSISSPMLGCDRMRSQASFRATPDGAAPAVGQAGATPTPPPAAVPIVESVRTCGAPRERIEPMMAEQAAVPRPTAAEPRENRSPGLTRGRQ
jgi:hypothetical protein